MISWGFGHENRQKPRLTHREEAKPSKKQAPANSYPKRTRRIHPSKPYFLAQPFRHRSLSPKRKKSFAKSRDSCVAPGALQQRNINKYADNSWPGLSLRPTPAFVPLLLLCSLSIVPWAQHDRRSLLFFLPQPSLRWTFRTSCIVLRTRTLNLLIVLLTIFLTTIAIIHFSLVV